MATRDPDVARLLTSPAFARSRVRAGALADDAAGLGELLDAVDRRGFGVGAVDDAHGRFRVDIVCSVVEARVEELAEPGARPVGELEPTTSARLRLVIAALDYLVTGEDAVLDPRPGHPDDLAVVHWVVEVANLQLPPMSGPLPPARTAPVPHWPPPLPTGPEPPQPRT